jgi:lipopolysaccharide assembly outer membrane protein LptD (OstA)
MLNRTSAKAFQGAVISFFLGSSWVWAAPAPKGPPDETTITSDQMELIDNASRTVFTGNVVLKSESYVLNADKMTRYRTTGIVEAEGHVVGTWTKPTGEKTKATGDYARYNPQTEIAELWGDPGRQITLDWQDRRGSGRFVSDRALVNVSPRRARLIDRVRGHVIPAP